MTGEQFCNFKTSSRINGCTQLRIQIVIERNQMCVGETVCALGNHRGRITPYPHLPITTQLWQHCFKRRDSIGVVFKK